MKWLLLQAKILLLESGIRKDAAVSINKESMDKSNSKNAFLRYFSLVFHSTPPYSDCLQRII